VEKKRKKIVKRLLILFFLLAADGGNMRSWLVLTFQTAKQADSQFFILRVVQRFYV
jgi:hypothetical protein